MSGWLKQVQDPCAGVVERNCNVGHSTKTWSLKIGILNDSIITVCTDCREKSALNIGM